MSGRDFDLILFGATGFTGRLAAQELCTVAPPGFRWAVAGRTLEKLEALEKALEGPCPPTGILAVDGDVRTDVEAMCARARVMATTAGPFALHGRHVPLACVENHTHYTDITGESPWVRDLVDDLHQRAEQGGVRIVPFCGFDSVPADLGAAHAVSELLRLTGQACTRVRAALRMRGGLNGGTIATALNMARQGRSMEMADPLLLNPPEMRTRDLKRSSRDIRVPVYDPHLACWLAPFVMAGINGHVVRRSHALRALEDGCGYGPIFNYQEGLAMEGPLAAAKAYGITAATAAALGTMSLGSPGRGLVGAMTPAAGRGPSQAVMDNGFVQYRFLAEGEGGAKIVTEFSASGDPGNRVTVTALCQSALALALDADALPGGRDRGGVLSPAAAFGEVLRQRLTARGFKWKEGELVPP